MAVAVILPDNTIAAVIMASESDPVHSHWPRGAFHKQAPEGCHPGWTYDPVDGLKPPSAPPVPRRYVQWGS